MFRKQKTRRRCSFLRRSVRLCSIAAETYKTWGLPAMKEEVKQLKHWPTMQSKTARRSTVSRSTLVSYPTDMMKTSTRRDEKIRKWEKKGKGEEKREEK
jgi:hypothetical protein